MSETRDIEARRLAIQHRLDEQKTQAERNRLGQFATPTDLAMDILRVAKKMLPSNAGLRFLDPAIGTGSFFSALLSVFPRERLRWAKGFEIDRCCAQAANGLWGDRGLQVALADFTAEAPPQQEADKANLIVCNPPYVRHHHLAQGDKMRLREATYRASGVALNGLAGLYCHFLCLSHAWLAQDGVALWLIPSEFMDVNYGEKVKEYLLNSVTLQRIHRFDPAEAQFRDAIVSSAVVCFRNKPPPTGHFVEFSYGGTLREPRICRRVSADLLDAKSKWTGMPLAENPRNSSRRGVCLSDLFAIRRGIATGANGFFVLPENRAGTLGLPPEVLTPILPSPRYLRVDEIAADEEGSPKIEKRLMLLDCRLSQKEVEKRYPKVWAYLQKGVADGVDKRYLCKHRQPWYMQEKRPPAPFLCTYMGRKKSDKTVFRFILNHSKATAANVYLLLYPKPHLSRFIAESAARRRAVWEALCRIKPKSLTSVGRVYGGGLHKVEPKELAAASADPVVQALPEVKQPTQLAMF
jgi:predicted RNA methylase